MPSRHDIISAVPLPAPTQTAIAASGDWHLLWANPHLDNDVLAKMWDRYRDDDRSAGHVGPAAYGRAPSWTDEQTAIGLDALTRIGDDARRVAGAAAVAANLTPGAELDTLIADTADTLTGAVFTDPIGTPRFAPDWAAALAHWCDLVAARRVAPETLRPVVPHLGLLDAAVHQSFDPNGGRTLIAAASTAANQPVHMHNRLGAGGPYHRPFALLVVAARRPELSADLADAFLVSQRFGTRSAIPADTLSTLFTLCAPWRTAPELVEEFCHNARGPVAHPLVSTAVNLLCCDQVPDQLRSMLRGGLELAGANVDLLSRRYHLDHAERLDALTGPDAGRVVGAALNGDDPLGIVEHLLAPGRPAIRVDGLDSLTDACGDDPQRWAFALELADGTMAFDEVADLVDAAFAPVSS